MEKPSYVYRARLAQRRNGQHPIYDADTVHLEVDCGFGIVHQLGACRLYGINAPEVRGAERERGLIARDWLRNELAEVDEFIIESFKDAKGKYGRYLVNIWIDGNCLNEKLVENGHAIKMKY